MQAKLTNPPAPAKLSPRDQWTVTGLCLGPMLIVMNITHVRLESGPLAFLVSLYPLIGMIVLSRGLAGLYTRLNGILARLNALENK